MYLYVNASMINSPFGDALFVSTSILKSNLWVKQEILNLLTKSLLLSLTLSFSQCPTDYRERIERGAEGSVGSENQPVVDPPTKGGLVKLHKKVCNCLLHG